MWKKYTKEEQFKEIYTLKLSHIHDGLYLQ
jgi:hypothetical protein